AQRPPLPSHGGKHPPPPPPAVAWRGVPTPAIPNWDIEGDITHTTWSRFKSLAVTGNTSGLLINRAENWDDTYSYRLGANHTVNANWDVRLGVLYDENPQPIEAVSPLLPDADREGVTFGLGYRHGNWFIDATEFVLH